MANGRIRFDFDAPAAATDLTASDDLDQGLTATVAQINAQLAAQIPPGTPITRSAYVLSIVKPLIDSIGQTYINNTVGVKASIDKVQAPTTTKAQRQAFVAWVAANIP